MAEEEMTEEEKAQADAKAAFEAALPAPGAPLMAARAGDLHVCPMVEGIKPHVGGPINPPGAPTVLIGGMPAATMGDQATCVGPMDSIVKGSTSVLICGKAAARLGDSTAHGGVISVGCPNVFVGG